MDRRILNVVLRNDFKSFVRRVFMQVAAGDEYLDNWHIDVMCDAVMNMRDGDYNRLIINIPPRYMKSIVCSVALPAFLLGHNPKSKIICISYNDELTDDFSNKCRNVMMSEWYRDLFPMVRLHPSRQAINNFETTRGGCRIAASVGGTITGRGADWIIIDDPQKPADTFSDTQREKLNTWYGTTLYSRLNDKKNGKILLVMQRLHQSDLTGHLLESGANIHHVKLPAIAIDNEVWVIKNRVLDGDRIITRAKGELLHPAREDVDTIAELQKTMGEYAFTGQYQQNPCPLEGGIVKEKWMQYYDGYESLTNLRHRQLFISWDTANKIGTTNAYSACCVVLMTWDYKFYLLQVVRGRWETPELFDKIIEVYEHWKYTEKAGNMVKMLIEDQASGTGLIQTLTKAMDHAGYSFNLEGIKPIGDKVSRLTGANILIEKGHLLFPKQEEPWWHDFKAELLGFPGGKYMDQVDALSQCINFAQQEIAG